MNDDDGSVIVPPKNQTVTDQAAATDQAVTDQAAGSTAERVPWPAEERLRLIFGDVAYRGHPKNRRVMM